MTNLLTTSVSAAAALAATVHHDLRVQPQVCPMCEATFPAVDVTHEVFVDHVLVKVIPIHYIPNYEVVDETEASLLPAYYVA